MRAKGSVLIIVLWVVAFLVLLALGTGNRAAMNLRMARNQKQRLHADCLAKSGVSLARLEIDADKDGSVLNRRDKPIVAPQGEFNFSLTDEERRMNFNGPSATQSGPYISQLFKQLKVDEPEELSSLIISWRDATDEEQEGFKNKEFSRPQELISVFEYYYRRRGSPAAEANRKALELYARVKEEITVFGDAKININTASPVVLAALAHAEAEGAGIDVALVNQLLLSIDQARQAGVFISDEALANAQIGTTVDEKKVFNFMKGLLKVSSDCYRIEAYGSVRGVIRKVSAVYDRRKKQILSWHEK